MNVIAFPNKSATAARENLKTLVGRARALEAFGPTVEFDSPAWDLSHHLNRRPGCARTSGVLYFMVRPEKRSRVVKERAPLAAPFAEFVKSVIVMKHLAAPTTFQPYELTLRASRFLYEALARCDHDIVEARTEDFHLAAASINGLFKPGGVQVLVEALQRLADFANTHRICAVPIRFSNPLRRFEYIQDRVDEEARAERSKKLPTGEYVAAVVDASLRTRNGGSDPDLARMSVLEELLCAPWRVNELLGVDADCERREERPDGTIRFGIAHKGSKGAHDDVKWVPSQMKPIAERAIADIKRLTQPSRDIALWMDENPGRAWLPEPWRLRDPATPMTTSDIAQAMGFAQKDVSSDYMRSRGFRPKTVGHNSIFSLGQVETAILQEVKSEQQDIPKGRRMSDYLFVFPRNYFHANRVTIPSIPTFLTQPQVRQFLVGGGVTKSIFERLDIFDSDGKPFRVPSHGPRHYLNNLANEGLLSELDIARWSGRKDVSQNAAYDHTGGAPLGRVVQKAVKEKRFVGGMTATVRKLRPADREAFLKARFATAHTTDIGMCVSDWSLMPCASHGACAAGCGDHVLIKGDPKHLERAQKLLNEHEAMLAQARLRVDEGLLGAGPWMTHNERMVEGLRKAIAVHEDAAIADGTMVQI